MKLPRIPLLIVALLALTAFAGCIGGSDDSIDPATDTQKEPPAKSEETKVTAETGSIKGEAMSVDLEPLGGAEVVLVETIGTDDEKSVIVAKDGSFVINEVKPGTYTVYVQAVLHNPARTSVVVKAGEVSQVSLLLEKIPDPTRPYIDQFEWVGLLNVAAAWQAEGPAGCIVEQTPVWTVKNCGGIRYGSASDNGEVKIFVPERAGTVMTALVWNPAGPLGERLSFDFMCEEVPRGGNGAVLDVEHPCYFDTPSTTSPIIHRVDKADWEEKGYNHTGNWSARVFATYGMLGTYDATNVDIGLAYEQTFKIFAEVWVNQQAPQDYSVLPDA